MSQVKMHRKFFCEKAGEETSFSLSGGAQFDLGDIAVAQIENEKKTFCKEEPEADACPVYSDH